MNIESVVKNVCKILCERKVEKVYIYPFGSIAYKIANDLIGHYGLSIPLIYIDNNLSKTSDKVKPVNYLNKLEWTERELLLIMSDNPIIYRELRQCVRFVPEKNVIDLFPINPLSYNADPRVAALSICSAEIYKNDVGGAVAETGVYRGDFAHYINIFFPDRKLYLIDPFEGFRKVDFTQMDNFEQIKEWDGYKSDTSPSTVIKKLVYPEQAEVKVGYVPDVLKEVDDRFAFVNLDMDLYTPTYSALCFFWERMNPGGVIWCHDVNNWDGCGMAIMNFCKEYNVGYVVTNDLITAAIAKPLT